MTQQESNFYVRKTNIIRDLLSIAKVEHYFNYLDTKRILNIKKLFIIDIIGSGSGLNSFLQILNAYYLNRNTNTPQLTFLNLTNDINWSVKRSSFYSFEQQGTSSNHGLLTLHEDKTKNIRPFKIEVYGIPVSRRVVIDMLDNDFFQEFLVHGIQYPAQKWTPKFDDQMNEGGKHHLKFYDYLRDQFAKLLKIHNLLMTRLD